VSKFHLHVLHPRLGKIANNLEKHGEEDVPGFTLPVSCELDRESLDGIMGAGFAARVFTKSGDPAPGFTNCAPMAHRWTWAKIHADLIAEEGGPSVLEFDGCHVKALTLTFRAGWMTECEFHLYLNPGLGEENLSLQKWQRQELGELVLTGGERQLKASDRQASLPLGGQGSAAPGAAGSQTGEGPVGSGNGDSVPAAQGAGEPVH